MHTIAGGGGGGGGRGGGCRNRVRESALEVDCERKIPSHSGESNPVSVLVGLAFRSDTLPTDPQLVLFGQWRLFVACVFTRQRRRKPIQLLDSVTDFSLC